MSQLLFRHSSSPFVFPLNLGLLLEASLRLCGGCASTLMFSGGGQVLARRYVSLPPVLVLSLIDHLLGRTRGRLSSILPDISS